MNNRDILLDLLSWELIDASDEDSDTGKPKTLKLLGKFDKYMIEKEEQNNKLHQNIQQWKRATFKNKKQA